MTNDPPDLSNPCRRCPDGALLPDGGLCPNPSCSDHIAPLMIRTLPEARPVWTDDVVMAPTADTVRYHAARFKDSAGRIGWAWRRE